MINRLVLPSTVTDVIIDGNLQSYLRNLIGGILFYLICGGLWSVSVYSLLRVKEAPSAAIQQKAIYEALLAMPIYVLLPTLTEYLIENGMTRAYDFSTSSFSLSEMLTHTLLFMASTEVMVYWVHRLLHDVPLFFKYLHHTHHLYNRTESLSPWASVAFNPIDGLLQASPYLINLFLIPIEFHLHMLLLFLTALWATNIHDTVIADTEPFMGSKYHLKHHTAYNCNYGQYFIFCDYIFGTLIDPNASKKVKGN
jgi:Delta7-sterol 5-desaturase